MNRNGFKWIVMLAAALASVPGSGQGYADTFLFLKAVQQRDGATVERMLAVPGTTVINSRDRSTGEGALHVCTRGHDLTWMTYLLGHGANPNLQTNQGDTPLSMAAQLQWPEGAQLLLARGANVNLANRRGESPLIAAVLVRNLAIVRLLLHAGANPGRADANGKTALDYARSDPRATDIVRELEQAR